MICSNRLTKRELEILYFVANGYSNFEIASSLFLSPNTIKASVGTIRKKLNAKNRTHAVFIAVQNGYLSGLNLTFNNTKSKR